MVRKRRDSDGEFPYVLPPRQQLLRSVHPEQEPDYFAPDMNEVLRESLSARRRRLF